MDIFNRKRVEELERDLRREKEKNQELQIQLNYAENSLKDVIELKESIPDGCTPGEYCRACEFSKQYYYHSYVYGIICNKANVCPNFIQKTEE